MVIHALGKAVPRAKKLADGVLKRRGQDVTLDVDTESVIVFDDVFPSGGNLEVQMSDVCLCGKLQRGHSPEMHEPLMLTPDHGGSLDG